MILKNDFNTLILVGMWNKAIFNPKWISKYLLPKEKKLQVELPLNVDGSARISSNKIRIYILGAKLCFVPLLTTDENFESIQSLACKTADYLPHTPVTAFGINFLFENDTNKDLIKIFNLNDSEKIHEIGAKIKNTRYTHSIEIDDLLINISLSTENNRMLFDFNFHFDISNLTEFKEQINKNSILKLKKIALNFMKEIYNLELNK